MSTTETPDAQAALFRDALIGLVRREGPDLSARQLGVFLICYLEPKAQTVRGLAERLEISKPAITRALDRLTELDLAARKDDPADKRSVLVQRTPGGAAFLRDLRSILRLAAATPKPAAATPKPAAARRRRAGAAAH